MCALVFRCVSLQEIGASVHIALRTREERKQVIPMFPTSRGDWKYLFSILPKSVSCAVEFRSSAQLGELGDGKEMTKRNSGKRKRGEGVYLIATSLCPVAWIAACKLHFKVEPLVGSHRASNSVEGGGSATSLPPPPYSQAAAALVGAGQGMACLRVPLELPPS